MPSVLLLDDEELVAHGIGRFFTIRGFEVTVLHSALAARKAMQCREFDVVISDFHMPWLDGIEVLELAMTLNSRAVRCLISALIERVPGERTKSIQPVLLRGKPFGLESFVDDILAALAQRAQDEVSERDARR